MCCVLTGTGRFFIRCVIFDPAYRDPLFCVQEIALKEADYRARPFIPYIICHHGGRHSLLVTGAYRQGEERVLMVVFVGYGCQREKKLQHGCGVTEKIPYREETE